MVRKPKKLIQPTDCRKPDAIDGDTLSAMDQRHVLPSLHPGGDRVGGVRVVGAEKVPHLGRKLSSNAFYQQRIR